MLNKNTQTVLKSLLPINNSFVVNYPTMTIIDEYKTLMGKVDLSITADQLPEFGIFDGARFLSALDLLEGDSEITLQDNLIVAKDANSEMEFLTSQPSSLEDAVAKEAVITSTEAIASVLECEVTIDTLNKLKKAAGVFKVMNTLFLTKNGPDIAMKIGSKENFNMSKDSYNIKVQPSLDEANNFELPIPLENIMKLPVADYTLKVKHNAERDVYRVILTNDIYTFLFTLMK